MLDNVSYVQGLAQPLVIIHYLYVSTASLSQGRGFRGTHRPTCLAASTWSLGVLCGRRGTWAPYIYIKYTWSIGNCATWCYIPAAHCWPLTFNR